MDEHDKRAEHLTDCGWRTGHVQYAPMRAEIAAETCFGKETEKMCPYVLTSHFGTRWHCQLFSEHMESDGYAVLKEKDGMLQRHPTCLKAEEGD